MNSFTTILKISDKMNMNSSINRIAENFCLQPVQENGPVFPELD
jgi:hypothetical protein